MRQLLALMFLVSLAVAQSQSPSLPTTWVDNEELTCQLNSSCYPGSPALTTPYTPPAYELALGANSWTSGPPPSYCTFSTSQPLYPATAAGKQAAINAIEACRTAGIAHGQAIGIILDVPPGMYVSANGIVIPQTSTVPATAPLIIRSTMDSVLASMPEPICAGGIQDNIPESTNIGVINSDCEAGAGGGTFAYQLGTTVNALPQGSFTLANGTQTSSSNYNYLQYMYQDECSATLCIPLQLCSPNGSGSVPCGTNVMIGPDHWEFEDGAAAMTPGNIWDNDVIYAGNTVMATNVSQFASHIHFRRYWSHGDWTSLSTGTNSMSAGFNLSGCYYCSVVGSQVSQALRPGSEGHAILGQGLAYKFDNDWLEGESSGVFSGGFSNPPTMIGYIPFQDVQMGRLRNTFPYSWLGVLKVPSSNPTKWAGKSIVRKNCEEMKEGERILVYGLICENVDNSGGQRGVVTALNVRNTSGGGPAPQNYQATITDLTIQNSVYRNACQGFGIDGRSDSSSGDGGGVSYMMDRIGLSNILQYDITTKGPGCPTTTTGIQITNGGGGQSWQGTIAENAAGTAATFVATCSVDSGGCAAGQPVSSALGFQVMDIKAGDPVGISNCTQVPAFNLQTKTWINGYVWPSEVQALATTGSAPWSGTFSSSNVTVTYNWTGAPAGAVDNSGSCTLTNGEGGPENFSINHMTFVTDATESLGDGVSSSNGPTFAYNQTFVNSIMLSGTGRDKCGATSCAGWWDDGLTQAEGNLTETYTNDTSSLTAGWLVWPGRPNTNYFEYPNNPSFPDPQCSATTGNWNATAGGSSPAIGGCNPANSFFFPATPYCTGASPSYSGPGTGCIGFTGAMNTSMMPLALADYHGYQLLGGASPSYFHSAASDGTDIGAIIPALDAAQTTTLYVCPPGSCLTGGPFPTISGSANIADTVTFSTSPSGLAYTVDGVTYTTQQTFHWVAGTSHSVATPSPQTSGPGSQYVFGSWSDGGAQSHTILAPAATTPYTVSFNTQYQLTTQALPAGDGSVAPTSGGYYGANSIIPITATANAGFAFANWSSSNGGSFDSSTSANANFTMPATPTTLTGNFTVVTAPVGTNTAVQSSENPSFTGDSVTITATVTYGSNSSVGANGSVTFTENGNPVAGGPTGPVALGANGQASFSTAALTEGTHSITATYGGYAGQSVTYLTSSAAVSQEVDNHTVVTGTQYCNQGAVALTASGTATPYPSKIFVSGASSSVTGVTLSLNQITSNDIQATDLLLVGPNGKQFVPFANAGDTSSISAVNVMLSDSAGNALPSGTPLTSGTFKPGSFTGGALNFASPAPAGPYDYAATDGASTFASEFNNSNPNGTWELLAQSGNGGGGNIAGGWCINLPGTPPVWSVTKSHSGNFTPGQTGTWSIAVGNTAASGASSGTVTVTDTLPSGYSVSSAGGRDWTCSGTGTQALTCTNSDAIAAGSSFGTITLLVNVPANSPGSVQNMATASGGGAAQSANSNTDTVTVNQAATITSANNTTFVAGTGGSFTVMSAGTPVPSLGETGMMPSGVSFVDNHNGTGALSGTPTSSGVFSISFSASNGVGSPATQTFTLTVNQAPAITSVNNTTLVAGTAGSFTLTSTGYPTAGLTETGLLPSGLSFVDNHNGTGTLSGTPTSSGVFSISFGATNGIGSPATQSFTLTVDQAVAILSANNTAFSVGTGSSFTVISTGYPIATLSETGALPSGVTFVDNPDGTGTLSGTPTGSGVYNIGFTAQNGVGSPAMQTFTLTVDQAAAITSANNTTFVVGSAGSFTVTSTSYPVASLSETGALPSGVTFIDNGDGTGTLSGTPGTSGVFSITFAAQSGTGSPATQTFTLTVDQAATITSANSITFTPGSAGTFSVVATGYPTPSLSESGTLPSGVTFVDNQNGTGTLSGTPFNEGVYNISFTAQNGVGSPAVQPFTLTVNQSAAISSANTASFVMGTAASFTVTTVGFPVPSIGESGGLPAGVTFIDNKDGTGTLSGTPTASGVYRISFTAQNGVGSPSTQTFTLTVNQAPAITSASSATFIVGTAGSFTVTTSGYPTAGLSETGTLPAGVMFADNHNGTGTLSGTPSASGAFSISFGASNGVGSPATQTFALTVNQAPAITSASSAAFVVGTAGSFTVTTSGYPTASLSETGTLPAGVTFADNHNGTGTLSGTPTASGAFNISFGASNGVGSPTTQTFALTVNQAPAITSASSATFVVGTSGSFTVTTTGYPTASLSETGTLPIGVTFVDNHNGTGALSGVPSASGAFSISFSAQNGTGLPATQTFTLTVNQAPAITSASSATFVVGTSGAFTVTTTGYPTASLSETGTLPGNVSFVDNHNGTGTLSGVPSASGAFSISFSAQNGTGSPATQTFTLTVDQAPAITSANNATFTVGTAGSFTVTTTGYPTDSLNEAGTLPGGLKFVDNHNGTGTLSGTPSASGAFGISFTAQNGTGSPATQTFTLTVNQAPAITSANNATFTAGTAGSFTVTTTGYPVPSLSETGTLPAGVTFVDNHNGTGSLSGSASGSGVFSISFTAQNGTGSPATQTFTLTVDQAPAITSASSTTFVVSKANSFTITTVGYPMASLSEKGTLPKGLTFVDNKNGTGTLSGTPTATGVSTITFMASNNANSATQTFTLTVGLAPAIGSANKTTFTAGTSGLFTVATSGYPTPSITETGTLPSGLTFVDQHNGNAKLSGAPTASGVFNLTMVATNSVGTVTQAFTLTVDLAPTITSANSTTFTHGKAGSFTVTTTGYPTPSVTESGTLPKGVKFVNNGNGTGTLSGTPTATGTFSITFTAANTASSATQTFTLTVN